MPLREVLVAGGGKLFGDAEFKIGGSEIRVVCNQNKLINVFFSFQLVLQENLKHKTVIVQIVLLISYKLG